MDDYVQAPVTDLIVKFDGRPQPQQRLSTKVAGNVPHKHKYNPAPCLLATSELLCMFVRQKRYDDTANNFNIQFAVASCKYDGICLGACKLLTACSW